MVMKCKNCRYFDRQIDPNDVSALHGFCLRYPPNTTLIQNAGSVGSASHRPKTRGDEWCGEWVKIDTIKDHIA